MRFTQEKSALMFLLAVTGITGAGASIAAEPERWTGEPFEILVTAPRMEVVEERRAMGQGARVSMSYAVRFADLDLGTDQGRRELEDRVEEAATEICAFLAERYNSASGSARRCTRAALAGAMEQVQVAVATYRAR